MIRCLFFTLLLLGVSALEAREVFGQTAASQERDSFENRPIASITFEGNQRFSSENILNFFRLIKQGGTYNKEKLAADLDRVRVLHYADNGYLRARFGEPQIEDTAEGLKIVVSVTEDVPYRFGEIKVEDATVFSPEQIIQMLGVESGDIVKAYSNVTQSIERLRKTYRTRGYIQMHINFIPEFRPVAPGEQEGVVDVTFALEEGVRFTINRIEFVGNATVRDGLLRDSLLIREGDIFNQRRLEKSMSRLNKLGLFEPVKEEDLRIDTDEKSGQVSITFHLKEKGSQ